MTIICNTCSNKGLTESHKYCYICGSKLTLAPTDRAYRMEYEGDLVVLYTAKWYLVTNNEGTDMFLERVGLQVKIEVPA